MKQRRKFSREFKLAAVKKVIEQGLSYSEVARDLGVRDTMIHNWRKAFESDGTLKAEVEQSPSVEAELMRLREENRQLKMERDILKKSDGLLCQRKQLRLQFIFAHRERWPITTQCRVLKVTRAAYYKWLGRVPAENAQKQDKIVAEIKRIHSLPRYDDYGIPRMRKELNNCEVVCCENTVAKLMRREGIRARITPRFRILTTDSKHNLPIAPNRLSQQFVAQNINQVWLTDFTYIPLREGFTYLCTTQDLCSRRIVGWATSRTIDAKLAPAALNQAVALRQPATGLIVHGDRGSQYASQAYPADDALHWLVLRVQPLA